MLEWVEESSPYRKDTWAGDAEVLSQMSVLADEEGCYMGSLGQLAELMGLERDVKDWDPEVTTRHADKWERRVERAVKRLIEMGAVDHEGPLEIRKSVWSGQAEWWEMPALILIPELRATTNTGNSVADVLVGLDYDGYKYC